jgi:hypothetical protein
MNKIHSLSVFVIAGLIVVVSALVAGKVMDNKLDRLAQANKLQMALVSGAGGAGIVTAVQKPDAPPDTTGTQTLACDMVRAFCIAYYQQVENDCEQQCLEDWADGLIDSSIPCGQECTAQYNQNINFCSMLYAACVLGSNLLM